MKIKKKIIPLLILNVSALLFFIFIFLFRQNYEFILYVGVIIFFLILILKTNEKVDYPLKVLWGLSIWSLMHMTGGGIYIGGKKVYEMMLFSIVGEPYNILRYDQVVHLFGFGIATLLMYYLIKPNLRNEKKWVALLIVVAMAGLGVGAFNEMVEFLATVLVPQTGVGGYENTALDLVSNFFGSIGAIIFIYFTEKAEFKRNRKK